LRAVKERAKTKKKKDASKMTQLRDGEARFRQIRSARQLGIVGTMK
jgi:hypothetical protein